MKKCELCNGKAALACEADDAVLCWQCDEAVHGANFLVAKHSRILLCRFCQEETPWNASGIKLGGAFSVCHRCSSDDAPPAEAGERVRGGLVPPFSVLKSAEEPHRCRCAGGEGICGGWFDDEEEQMPNPQLNVETPPPNPQLNAETPPPNPSSSSCAESSSEILPPIRSGFFARKGRNASRRRSDREISSRRAMYAGLHREESEEEEAAEEAEATEEGMEEEVQCLSECSVKPTNKRKRSPPPTPSTGASRRRRTLNGRPSAIRRFPDYTRRENPTRV